MLGELPLWYYDKQSELFAMADSQQLLVVALNLSSLSIYESPIMSNFLEGKGLVEKAIPARLLPTVNNPLIT